MISLIEPRNLSKLDSSKIQFLRELALRDLFFFANGILGFKDLSVGFHRPLCELLQNCEILDKLCVLPRGTFKTSLCTVAFPLWMAVRNPNITCLIVQNTFKNALAKLSKIRDIVERCALFRLLFPEVLPTKESTWRTDSLCFNRSEFNAEGTFDCAGVGTGITGRHYDLIIEDDTVAPDVDELTEENVIPTKEDIGQAIGYHNLLYPILKATGKPQNLVVGTRWFEHDLISHIQSKDKGFHVYERAIRETDGRADFDGTPTFPEVFTEEKLQRIEGKVGPYLFSCNPAGAPIMLADWSSKPIEEIQVGDRVIGFEFPEEAGEHVKTVPTRVIAVGSRVAKVVKITMLSGRTIRCTPDHKWLADMNRRRSRPHHLYRPAGVGRPLHYLCNPDVPPPNEEANLGWLAGMFDGEGGISGKLKSGAGSHLIISQSLTVNPDIHAEIGRQLTLLGLAHNKSDVGYTFGTSREDRRRFFQWCYPFVKWHRVYETLWGARCFERDDVVVRIEPDGEEIVYSFQTETGNYVCWGYASKNCLYMNRPVRSEDMVFRPEWIGYYETEPLGLLTYTTVDPGGDPQDTIGKADYNVVLTCGLDLRSGVSYVLEYFHKRCNPSEMMNALFDHARKYAPLIVGIESVGYQKQILHYARQRMIDEKLYFRMEPIQNSRRSKNSRILGLQPHFSGGKIKIRHHMQVLRQELLSFPLGANDDLADALAMQLDLWAVGSAQSETSHEKALNDPLSLDSALEELDLRRSRLHEGIVFDSMGSTNPWN